MLTCWTMSTGGKYSDYYPQRLKREVGKYLSIPHRFRCIADHDIDGVETVDPPTDYPGWWGKIGLFKPGFVTLGPNLWLDLDVVITGSLDPLVRLYGNTAFAAAKNWAQSGHGGVQSSVMIWDGGAHAQQIYNLFNPDNAHWPPVNQPGKLWGDQEFITTLRDKGLLQVSHIREQWVRSYKYHCRQGLPEDCRVVVFHGSPNPGDPEVNESWFAW